MLECIFVTGSNARGCMVVLVGDIHNTTVNLTREGSCGSETVNLTATNISVVFGFDIESDGSIGTLALPGNLRSDVISCSNGTTEMPMLSKYDK